jgi:hypothetical protein
MTQDFLGLYSIIENVSFIMKLKDIGNSLIIWRHTTIIRHDFIKK